MDVMLHIEFDHHIFKRERKKSRNIEQGDAQ
jgi:hypothetical protein